MSQITNLKTGQKFWQATVTYRGFDDEIGNMWSSKRQAEAEGREMRDACDPAHQRRSDISFYVRRFIAIDDKGSSGSV